MGYLSSCRIDSAVVTCDSIAFKEQSRNNSTIHNNISNNSIEKFNYRELVEATGGFSQQKLLGKGSHGSVYKAVLRNGKLVAVKRPAASNKQISALSPADRFGKNEVENEIEILSNIYSPRLVNLVGFSSDYTRERLLVVEFMSNGTLYDVLHSNPNPPGWHRRIRLALQTAKAIETLHSSIPAVIHRDIKSANVLIDRNFNARLGDFGLALRCHDNDFRLRSTPPAGTLGYLDPDYVTPDNLSTKNDVFSFGILLLEIISGRKAIDMNYSPPSILDWAIPLIRKGKLLAVYDPRVSAPKDEASQRKLLILAAKCVRSIRDRRPTMKRVVECLDYILKTAQFHIWSNFSVSVNPCIAVEDLQRNVYQIEGTISRNNSSFSGDSKKDDVDSSTAHHDSIRINRPLRKTRNASDEGSGVRSSLSNLFEGSKGEYRHNGNLVRNKDGKRRPSGFRNQRIQDRNRVSMDTLRSQIVSQGYYENKMGITQSLHEL